MRARLLVVVALVALATTFRVSAQEQLVDSTFVPQVTRPAYAKDGPSVVIDEAHLNFHTAGGQYAPFAALLRADGYSVSAGTRSFDAETLRGVDILVIANAGSPHAADTTEPAFTDAEADALEAWVRTGGSLLLIADHAPFGITTERLAARFGVGMGKGWLFERAEGAGLTTQLVYSRANGRLGDHPVTRGRTPEESLMAVKSFTGQSLAGPVDAAVLLRIPSEAWESPDRSALNASAEALLAAGASTPDLPATVVPAGGRAQGLAFTHGTGRVVVLGEAGMLSAQLIRFPQGSGREDLRFGMNVEGFDNQQFALNLMHWLSGILD